MYLSQDPIGLAGNNPTLYGYVKNPNTELDLLGLNLEGYIFNLPKNPSDLISNGWENITHPTKASNTNMLDLRNPATGQKVEFHPGKPGVAGWEGVDHYHIHNPNSTGKLDQYLDKNGNPVAKNSNASHIKPTCS
jgi:uncharacterized protein RhaS with RHS repeats